MSQIKRILVSQPKPATEKSPYFDIEAKYDVKIDFKQLIKIEGVTTKEFRTQKINILDHTAIIFPNKLAVDHFFRICEEMKIKMHDEMRYIFPKEEHSHYISKYVQYRKRRIYFPADGSGTDMIDVIKKRPKEKYLAVVSDVYEVNKNISVDPKDDYLAVLSANNIQCEKAVMYRTVSVDYTQDPDFKYDMMAFFTPSGIHSLFDNFPDFKQGDIKIACFGPTVVKAAEEAGLRVDIQCPTDECKSMPAAIENYLKNNQ